jgi:hypothetical protein
MTILQKAQNYKGLIDKKPGVKLKKIQSLMVNWGSNCINPRPRTKMQKAPKSEV